MKCSIWGAWTAAAVIGVAAAGPAQAGLVTFEDLLPDIAAGGGTLSSGGYNFTDDNNLDLHGSFIGVDTALAFSGAAPANASGQFLYAANSAGFAMTAQGGQGFHLASFDAAFIAPIPGQAGALPGRLTVALFDILGSNFATEVFDLAAGLTDENFPFATLTLRNTAALSQAQFYTCAYQADTGDCERFGNLPAQFAIDNIDDSRVVPEPGTVVLALTALGLLAVRRRQAA